MMPETIAHVLGEYKPLILAQYRKFHGYFYNYMDKQELMFTIQEMFIKLCIEYNPRYGVDFPYYIKKKLGHRVYHYVIDHLAILNNERNFEDVIVDDYEIEDSMEFIENLESINTNITLGTKQKNLLHGILLEHKTIKELAEEEGVASTVLHTRLHFLIDKIKRSNNESEFLFNSHFEVIRTPIIRVPVFFIRKPIIVYRTPITRRPIKREE